MKQSIRSLSRLWLWVLALLVAQQTQAQLLTEDFPNAGALTANGWTQVQTTATNPINASTPNLVYTGLATGGNAAILTTTGQDVSRSFTAQTSGAVYASGLVSITSAQTGDYFFHLANTAGGTSLYSRLFVKSASAGIQFGIAKNGTTPAYVSTPYALNTTYFIVIKYTYNPGTGDDVASVFINPVLGDSEPAPAATDAIGTDATSSAGIGAVNLRQGNPTAAPNAVVDYIRLGTNWADVTKASVPGASLAANPTTLSGYATTQGTASASKSYALTGSNLDGNPVSVSATAGIDLSTDNSTFAPTVSIPATTSAVSTTIYARISNAAAAGAFSGTITNTVNGTLTAAVTVSGTVSPAGSSLLVVNPTSLTGVNGPTALYQQADNNPKSFTFTASNLPLSDENSISGVTVTTNPDGMAFGVSATREGPYQPAFFFPAEAGTFSKEVWVTVTGGARGRPGQAYTGALSVVANNKALINIPVSGTLIDGRTPTLIVSSATLNPVYTIEGVASDKQTYVLAGRSLTSDVTVTAPTGFQVSLDGITFQNAITVVQSNGAVGSNIYFRLAGTQAGTFSGNITNTSEGATTISIPVSGTVTAEAPYTPIWLARNSVGRTKTIAGRVTATNQLGSRQIYIQDNTGGIVVYSGSTGTDLSTLVQLGDSVQARGPITVFNGFTEITSAAATSFTIVSSAGTRVPTPIAITPDQLANYQGQLVSIANASITPVASTFTGGTNYTITANGQSATLRINANSPLAGAGQPANPVSVTGIADRFVSGATTAGTDGLQLQPRILADIPGSTPAQDLTCTAGMSNSTLGTDQTLDIATWNMEFFGADAGTINCPNGSLNYNDMGPTNEDLQQSNAVSVLTKLKADIVGVEEVSNLDRLAATVASLPGSYSYACSDRFSYYFQNDCDQTPSGNPPTVFGPTSLAQKVCVIYNRATVTPVLAETKALLTDKYSYPSANNWSSGRLPFLFVGDVTINGITQRVHVVTIHAKSGSATADYNRRKQDIIDLKANLDATYPNAKLIILGDYNDKLNGSIASGQQSSYKPFVDDASNYSALTLPLENNNCSTFNSSASFIDHMIISNDLAPAAISNSTYVLQPFSIPNYGNTTSDHNPVVTRFDLTKLATPVTALTVTATASPDQILTSGSTTLSANVSGGTAPYSYSFTGPGTITATGNTATVSGLSAGVQTFTVTVADATTPTAQTSFTTVSVTVTTASNPTLPFSITGVTLVSCTTLSVGERQISFSPQYAGVTGETISFRVANESTPTTAAGPYSLKLYADNPVISLRAVQGSGSEVSYAYDWLAACNTTTPTNPTNTAPVVANAVAPQSATAGSAYTLSLANVFTDEETPNQLSLSASGLPAGLSLSGTSIGGTPSTTVGSPYTVTVTATDAGNLSTSTSFVLTVSPSTVVTPTVPFSITGVTLVSCTTLSVGERQLSFSPQYAGLTGEAISFRVANESAPTMAAGPYSLKLYTDNPVISLRAVQGSGSEVSYAYNWLAACNTTTPTNPTNTAPVVANAVAPQSATAGSAYTLSLANVFTDEETPNQLSLSASGLPAGLGLSSTSISGTPSTTVGSPYTVTVTATDAGNLSTSTSFVLTVSPSTVVTPTLPFSITGVTLVSCTADGAGARRISFTPRYAGVSGESISFRVANESEPTTAAGPYSLRLYTDNPVISLRAVQGSGAEVSYAYNWLAACNAPARIGVAAESSLDVRVIGNPINDGQATVEVRGTVGQPLTMQLIDMRGQTVGQHAVEQAGMVETHTFAVGRQPVGTLLLRVATPTQSQTVKLLKVN